MHEGLPVKGYVAQSAEKVDIVNAHKITEEGILRQIEHLQMTGIGDPRWLAIAKTGFEQAAQAARIDVGEGRAGSLVVATEAPVTDEMAAAGAVANDEAWTPTRMLSVQDTVARIYRAMAAVAPVELYRADERKIDALTAQRDAWTGIAVRYKEQIVALEAENLALKAQIAAFTAANVAKPADARKPMPANALAGRRDDPRRIGS